MPREATQWKKGQSGNPSGGKKKEEWQKKDFLKKYGRAAFEQIVDMMENSESEATRLACAKIIVEYAEGKPKQTAEIVADLGEETREALSGASLKEKIERAKKAVEAIG